jgi:long-chain acyl-CoA synthetase
MSTPEELSVRSTIVPNTNRADRGDIRRSGDPLAHPQLGLHGCRTMYEGFRRGCSLNPLGPCLGFRAVSTSGFATPYIYSSYSECLARVDAFAAGLETLNLVEPSPDNLMGLGLYMKNCMEWVLAEHAIYALGGCTVPFYDTLGPDTVHFILNQTGCKSLVCSRAELSKVCEAKLTGGCGSLKAVILADGVTPDAAKMAEGAGLEILSYAKVEAVGAERITRRGHKHNPPSPDDVATFCYTSGTTGDPKGALITHENLISTIAGVQGSEEAFIIKMFDRHLSFLPLPHIFERIVMAQMFTVGASIAFHRCDPLLLIEDIQACRPTMMPAAPRLLNKIHDKVSGVMWCGDIQTVATASQ